MDTEIIDLTERQLREVLTRVGLRAEDIDKAIKDYMRYRETELSDLSLLTPRDYQTLGAEDLYKKVSSKLRDDSDIVEQILRQYLGYLYEKREIVEAYQESKSWDTVITTVVYSDSNSSQEAFIDYVEEVYQIKVKDAKHLQKLTGITEETLEGLQETLISSRYSKYTRAIETALKDGAMYKDLLQIKPKDYGLPETWSSKYGEPVTQYNTILMAIGDVFRLGEPISAVRPDLKTVAKEIQAPYSVLMDANKLCNKWKLQS